MYFKKKEFVDAANSIQKQINYINAELNSIGTGSIVCRKRNGRLFFSERIENKERGITRDQSRIHQLARKEYLHSLAKILSCNLDVMKYCGTHYIDSSPEQIAEQITQKHPNLPANMMLTSSNASWTSMPYQKNPYHPENLEYITPSGIIVRSKSEREIANTLEAMDVPYKHDMKIQCGQQTYYADFVIKRSDGSLVIWEHFGRTHDKIYCAKNEVRIRDYISLGYRPWDNLIWTFESDIKDSRNIRKIIQRFILASV